MNHGYNLHQMQGNQIYGFRKSGYLLKKSEGKMRVKAWRKRRCEIKEDSLFIYHSDETQTPTKLNLLTCQVKLVPGKEKKCFDLISFNRTYHFQVEDEHDITAWVYVLINCKEGALKKQFDDPNSTNNNSDKDCVDFSNTNYQNDENAEVHLDRLGAEQRVQQQLIRQVQALLGNDKCVDCSSTKDRPTWLSTNLGVLVCIECSGIHRDLGVHISRIQSLTLDNINTSQLLIAHNMGNEFFNSIFESKLRQLELLAADIASPNFNTPKLKPNSTMDERCEFIKAKYIQRKFCQNTHKNDIDRSYCLRNAVIKKDLKSLVQLYGEGFNIASTIPLDDDGHKVQPHDCTQNTDVFFNHCHHPSSDSSVKDQSMVTNNIVTQSSLDDSIDTTFCHSSKPLVIDGDTSIHLALSCQAWAESAALQFECDLYILDFIVQNSRAINAQNSDGETPLHYSAKFFLPECMKLLLKFGADISIKNNNGETPYDIVQKLPKTNYKKFIDIIGKTDSNLYDEDKIPRNDSPSKTLNSKTSIDRYSPSSSNNQKSNEKRRYSITLFKYNGELSANNNLSTNSESKSNSISCRSPDSLVEESRLAAADLKNESKSIKIDESITFTDVVPNNHMNSACNTSTSNITIHSNNGSPNNRNQPIPPPRRRSKERGAVGQPIKARALYKCVPDNPDELGFEKDEIILITNDQTADQDWWQGYIESEPERHGVFPAIFVRILHE